MTKKNKKVIAIISILFVFIYLLSSALLFGLTQRIEVGDFTDFAYDLDHRGDNTDYYANLTAEEFVADYTANFSGPVFSSYPFIAALYNSNGEIAAQTGSYITIPIPEDSGSLVDRRYKYIFIDELLTKETKKEISRFLKGIDYMVNITEFNYYKNGDEILPVSVTVTDLNQSPPYDRSIKLDLYDKEITDTYKMEFEYDEYNNLIHHNDGYNIRFVDINDNSRYHKNYEHLNQLVIDSKEKAMEHYKGGSGGGFFGPDEMYTLSKVTLADGEYMLCIVSEFNSIRETLLSRSFIGIMAYQSVFFAVFYIVLITLLTVYYKRSRKIEEAKIAFTSAAAHELKTPLAVIENQCECIMENIAPEKNAEYVKSIYSESLRMNKLVATLLQYNRLVSAESIQKEKCDLAEIVNSEIEKYRPLIESKSILLETIVTNSIEINCNTELIALVIDNYLSNAIKHTDEGKKIAVTLSVDTFAVFNEGKNIDTEQKKKLWDIFYRDDEARNSEDNSTGMGLAICKQILEHHKYEYGFTNKPDGVEFYFKVK